MKKIDLGQTIQILANVGVLAGILFLAFELRQNTMATRSAAASSIEASFSEAELFIAGNAEFAELLTKGRAGEEGLKKGFRTRSVQ